MFQDVNKFLSIFFFFPPKTMLLLFSTCNLLSTHFSFRISTSEGYLSFFHFCFIFFLSLLCVFQYVSLFCCLENIIHSFYVTYNCKFTFLEDEKKTLIIVVCLFYSRPFSLPFSSDFYTLNFLFGEKRQLAVQNFDQSTQSFPFLQRKFNTHFHVNLFISLSYITCDITVIQLDTFKFCHKLVQIT